MKEFIIGKTPVKMWADTCDPTAWQQIENICSLPFIHSHLALMPDVHAGTGMTIGGVLATSGVVIPNAVGVDIGCGMCAVKTNTKVADIPREVLRDVIVTGIRERIPVGMAHQTKVQPEQYLPQGFDIDKLPIVNQHYQVARQMIGTLGGGNHFIELQRDTEGYLWIMIHSGSRQLGKKVGDYYNEKAKSLNARWYSSVSPEINLAFLPLDTPEFKAYWAEMEYCVQFALANRALMIQRIEEVLSAAVPGIEFEPMINIAHNYAAWEKHFGKNVIVHRKGATRVRQGEIGIIPGSQGTSSYIVDGLGNPLSFESCSHGAGRAMGRKEACRRLDLQSEIAKLDAKGVIHSVQTVDDLEEAASAYKDIDTVMAQQSDLVTIRTRLEPVAVVKG